MDLKLCLQFYLGFSLDHVELYTFYYTVPMELNSVTLWHSVDVMFVTKYTETKRLYLEAPILTHIRTLTKSICLPISSEIVNVLNL